MKDELEHPEEVLECSVESLAEIESESSTEVHHCFVHLFSQLSLLKVF